MPKPQTQPRYRADGRSAFDAAARSFRVSMEAANLSPATIYSYMHSLGCLRTFLDEQGMPADARVLTREHIEAFIMARRAAISPQTGKPYAPSTIVTMYLGLHAFFKWLVEMDEIQTSPMARMRPPKAPRPTAAALSDEQIKRILARCEGKGFEARRDMAIVRLLVDTGMRVTEMVSLRLDMVDFEARSVAIVGKGRKPRICWFGVKSLKALDLYVNWARPTHRDAHLPNLWLGQRGVMTRSGIAALLKIRGELAGVPGLHPHMFRHHAASSHLIAGGTETNLMRRMGWQSRSMVGRYTASAADEVAREEYNRLGLGDKL